MKNFARALFRYYGSPQKNFLATPLVILTTVIIILARAKYKVQIELKELQSRANVLYEEIVIPPTNNDLTCRNVAYDCVTK